MIVPDASILIPWLSAREQGERLVRFAEDGQVMMAPVVLAEVLSGRLTSEETAVVLAQFPTLPTKRGYWVRTGLLRRTLLQAGRRARLADSLLAQACLDHDLPLLTRDTDFQAFAEVAGLKLVV